MQLPFKHILAVRTSHSLSEYDETLCAEKWKLRHFLSNHRAYVPNDSSGSDADGINISTHISEPASTVLSEQKYRKASKVTQNLCQQLSTFGIHDFNEGIEVLQSVATLWDGGKKVLLERQQVCTVQYSSLCYCHCVCYITFCSSHLLFPHFV